MFGVNEGVVTGVGIGPTGERGGETLLMILSGETHSVERAALSRTLRENNGT